MKYNYERIAHPFIIHFLQPGTVIGRQIEDLNVSWAKEGGIAVAVIRLSA
jgi:hypothetical protein